MEIEVAGVFLERDGGLLLHALAKSAPHQEAVAPHASWEIEYLEHKDIEWGIEDKNEAIQGICNLAEFIKNNRNIKSVAVASYGPFRSLTAGHPSYGAIQKISAHEPLRGVNLKEVFTKVIGDYRQTSETSPKLIFHTDAAACALGEAYERQIGIDEILGFICVTEGIGLGIVKGRTIITSALHPEIGLMPMRFKNNDLLKPKDGKKLHSNSLFEIPAEDGDSQYSGSLEELAANPSIIKRSTTNTLDEIWDIRAYYLAQACLSYTTIFPPHHIVIGSNTDPDNSIGKRVQNFFEMFLQKRRVDKQPVFGYEELDNPNFISCPLTTDGQYLATIGAIGMCHAAATAHSREAVVKNIETAHPSKNYLDRYR